MKQLHISLIIPAYNEERYLKRCLESVAAQTRPADEVIVVDNGSDDATVAIAARFPLVTVLREPKRGTVYARDVGFDHASGDLLVRIDADVRLPTDWLENLVRAASQQPVAAYTGSGTFYDTAFPRSFGRIQAFFYQYLQWPAVGSWTLWGATMAIRREAWLAVRPYCYRQDGLDEDIDLTLQLRRQGFKIAFLPALTSEMSLRRDQTDPVAVGRYLSSWPQNYQAHKRPLAAAYISLLTAIMFCLTTLAWFVTMPPRKID